MSLCLLTKLKSKALKWTAYWEVYSSNLPKRGRSKICFVGIPDLGPRHLVNKTAICLSWLSVFSVVVCYFWSWYQCCQNFQFYLNLVWFLLRMQKISFVFKSKLFWVKCSWKLQLLTFNQNLTKWFKSWLHCQTQLY